MSISNDSKQTGYLLQDFRLFHLKDQNIREFEFHYHDFNKIIIFLSGNVTYIIEGKAYFLKPWDILLVNNHDVHKPIIDSSSVYERIIIWLKPSYLSKNTDKKSNNDITYCFQKANERSFNLIRLNSSLEQRMKQMIIELEEAIQSEEFGSDLLANSLFTQFMIYLNRIFLGNTYKETQKSIHYDERIEEILKYINQNLSSDLTIDSLASRFYLNKYYFMHKFKKETGYTIHQYILQKRLLNANLLIQSGTPIVKSSQLSGFTDYSTFLRAYKKMFQKAPSS